MLLGALTILCIFHFIAGISGFENSYISKGKGFLKWWIVVLMIMTFIPSQKQLAFIIAAPYIIENEDLQQAGKNTGEIIKLGTEYLKDILDEKRTQTVSNGD